MRLVGGSPTSETARHPQVPTARKQLLARIADHDTTAPGTEIDTAKLARVAGGVVDEAEFVRCPGR